MCGILVTSGLDQPFSHLSLASLRRRGPDAIGFWSDQDTHISQTRLAIIGLHERGIEPLENETHVLAYNGEIYNFEEIRRRLERDGPLLTGANDAEVLLHAWSRWGPEILSELSGFWAFVIYDKASRTLSLVRDQLGIKPLYYSVVGTRVCVASMIRTILETTKLSPVLDYEALSEYAAYQFTFGDKTFLSNVKKVLPGHIVEIDLPTGATKSRCYEDIFDAGKASGERIDGDWIDKSRDLLLSCVFESTVSDVPYATFCSGGMDSSLITRIIAPELAYHCNYSDPDCNETFFAQEAVAGTSTRLYVVNAEESFDLVAKLSSIVEDFDELSIGSVILPLDDLLRQVSRRHKVILSGTGGDELFGGYVRYQLARGECFQDSYRGLFTSMSGVDRVSDRFEMSHRKGNLEYYRFYNPDVQTTFHKAYDACRVGDDDDAAMLSFDRRYFLGGLLNIDDKMAARHSIESRPSLLHQRFVRHVNAAAPSAFLGTPELKSGLRNIAAPLLPRSITHRTDKMGFTTPIGVFVQQSVDLVREQLVQSPFGELYDLRRMSLAGHDKFSRQVFGLLMLDLWLNRYVA